MAASPPAACGDLLRFVLESDTSGRVKSEHGKYWGAKLDRDPWIVGGRIRGWVLTTGYGSGRGALRGAVRGARQINLLCSSLEVAVREAWKQADAKLAQGRSDRCGPDSKTDLYDLKVKMAPPRPPAHAPPAKRAREE